MSTPRKFKIGKWGLKETVRHHTVTLHYGDRELIGTVTEAYYHEVRGCILLRVKHFCGDRWPIDPQVLAVSVIG